MSRTARVYDHNKFAGLLEERDDGLFRFTYDRDYLKDQTTHGISKTLPKQPETFEANDLFPFFDGLIPEGWLLDFTTKSWKVSRDDRMGLLLAVCHDCIGSVHVGDAPAKKASAESSRKPLPDAKKNAFKKCLRCLEPLKTSEGFYHERCSKLLFDTPHAPALDISLGDIESFAETQVNQRLAVTGVQRKLSLDLDEDTRGSSSRLTVVGFMGHYILKPPTPDYNQLPEIEHTTMALAEICGIPTAVNALIPLASGELAYITKRFDRLDETKIAMEDLCQLSGKPTKNKYKSTSENAAKFIRMYSDAQGDDTLKFFEHLLFAFLVGNGDMHLKNFSLYEEPTSGLFKFTPAYDLLSTRLAISAQDDAEELALMINGKKINLKWSDFAVLGKALKIPDKTQERVRNSFLGKIVSMQKLIQISMLGKESQKTLQSLIKERARRLKD